MYKKTRAVALTVAPMGTQAGPFSLDQLAAFAGCSRSERAAIRSLASAVSLPAGALLTHEGDPGRECFIIASGEAEVLVDGRPIVTLGPGEVVGEVALLARGPRTATVRARTDMSVFVLAPNEFSSLLEHRPAARLLLTQLARRLRLATWDGPA